MSLESLLECGIVHHRDQDSESSWSSGKIAEPSKEIPKELSPPGYGFDQPAIIIYHERAHEATFESQVLLLESVMIADSDSSSIAETDSLREDTALEGKAVLS